MTTLGIIPGDGTGPEVITEALKVLDVAAAGFELDLAYRHFELGGDRYLRTGETLPDATLQELREVDSILFGAVGHPGVEPGILERDILLRLRKELDQFVNVRPVRLHPGVQGPLRDIPPEEIDLVIVRENSEGLYAGAGFVEGEGTPDEQAVQESHNSRRAIERTVRHAFDLAKGRTGRVTLCGKTNVLTHAWGLWQRVFDEVAADHPNIVTAYAHVDAACLWMVEDPARFDVIVTDNMFGDILSDLGAAIQGGLGIAAGGNINPGGVSMFEPIGGTAPGFEGTGKINPLAAIAAAAMMLDQVGEGRAAEAVAGAVASVAGGLPSLRAGEMEATTAEVGSRVARLVAAAPGGREAAE